MAVSPYAHERRAHAYGASPFALPRLACPLASPSCEIARRPCMLAVVPIEMARSPYAMADRAYASGVYRIESAASCCA
jgi:hypothetical protein